MPYFDSSSIWLGMTTPCLTVQTRARVLGAFLVFLLTTLSQAAEVTKRQFDVPAGSADQTLKQLSKQSDVEVIYSSNLTRSVRTNEVKGEYTPREALERMLADTGLVGAEDQKTGALTVRKETPDEAKNAESRPAGDQAAQMGVVKLDTFEVMGSKLLNMDIKRSRDDAQPYVTFDRAVLEQSGATNLNEFLRQRLTMNVVPVAASQSGGNLVGFTSAANLRSIGQGQTLILIDGHRVPDFNIGNTVIQADFNNIPVAAVERIEVLPTTSSGIYGGSATGGVINFILRRDYRGTEIRTTYENTFSTDAATRRIDLASGMTLEGGRTNILLAATYSDSTFLLARDRNIIQSGIAKVLANNPAIPSFLNLAPPLGGTTNIRSSTGANLVLKNGTALSSPITFVPVGYAGAAGDAGSALAANAGRYNFNLGNDATSANATYGGAASLFNAPKLESIMVTVRRQFSPGFQAFLDMAASNSIGRTSANLVNSTFTLPASAPNNPFQQAILVTVPHPGSDAVFTTENQNRRLVGGAIAQLPWSWKAEADYTWQRYSDTRSGAPALKSAGTTAITSGALDVLRDVNTFPLDLSPYLGLRFYAPATTTELNDGAVRASGPVGALPTGDIQAAVLLEHRVTDMAESRDVSTADGTYSYYPSRSQSVSSAYVELHFPLIAASNRAAPPKLELQLAGRQPVRFRSLLHRR